MPSSVSYPARSMIAAVRAGTLHTVVTRRRGRSGCGTLVHTIPEPLAMSIAATAPRSPHPRSGRAVSGCRWDPYPRSSPTHARKARRQPKSDQRARSNSAQPSHAGLGTRLTCKLWAQGNIGVGGQRVSQRLSYSVGFSMPDRLRRHVGGDAGDRAQAAPVRVARWKRSILLITRAGSVGSGVQSPQRSPRRESRHASHLSRDICL
jgi:hypothetical protein